MRKQIVVLSIVLLLVVVAFSSVAFAQSPARGGWKTCPQCQSAAEQKAERDKVAKASFNPKDLNGVWGQNRVQLATPAPPFTPAGQKMYEATKSEDAGANSKDGMLTCDPLGWPRWFTYNYGFEFVQLPDRLLQFFEWDHTWRTIWMDGRELPKDPDPRWLGYSVGRWEGDTLVIETTGFDDRAWLDQYGNVYSSEMRFQERWSRPERDSLQVVYRLDDPKSYTKPWVSTTKTFKRQNGVEIREEFCAPVEEHSFNERIRDPAGGRSTK